MGKKIWKAKLVYAVYVCVILNLIVTTERIVFDVFGRMWITLLVNAFTGLSTLVCLLGLYYRRKTAIIAYGLISMATVGINVVIILMYNNVGILKGTEGYLSIPAKSHSWWTSHGFLCYPVCNQVTPDGGGGGEGEGSGGTLSLIEGTLITVGDNIIINEGSGNHELTTQACFVTYTLIESAHSALNAFLTLSTVLLSLCMILREEKSQPEEEPFQYMSIGRYGGTRRTPTRNNQRPSYYKLSDSFDTVGSRDTESSSSSM